MIATSPLSALAEKWRGEVNQLTNRYAAQALANLTSKHTEALEQALKQGADERLTLTKAAEVSGFTADHLGRLIRQGKLRNVGRRNAPRVRRGDLPSKISALRESSSTDIVSLTRTQLAQAVKHRT